MDERFFDEIKHYVGFGEGDVRALIELRPLLEANCAGIIERFYQRILEHPRARGAITGGQAQVERLKGTLRRWLVELADGVYDAAYLERRAMIGRRHVVIDLPQVFMVTAMDLVRREIGALVREEYAGDVRRREAALEAVHKILDMDLAIMLETYREDSLEKTVRSERRAAVGELAGRVNHELRHRLGVIKSSAYLLEQKWPEAPEPVRRHLKKIEASAESAGTIVARLLDLARELKPCLVRTDLNHVVRDAVASLPREGHCPVELTLAAEPLRVQGDPELLSSLVANLVMNALEAHDGKPGRVVVRTALEGDEVVLRVVDEGRGLAPEVAPKRFEPFFTTKPHGTGLGRPLARDIVSAHGGRIEARNRADRTGAEFEVALAADRSAP